MPRNPTRTKPPEEVDPEPRLLRLRGTLPGMNEIIAANRDFRGRPGGSYTKLKREIEEYVLWEATLQKFEPIRGAYRVDTTWYVTNSRRDPDNIRAGIKFVLDALVRGGFLGGDSLRWCRSLTDGFSVVKGEDHCSITIQPWLEN